MGFWATTPCCEVGRPGGWQRRNTAGMGGFCDAFFFPGTKDFFCLRRATVTDDTTRPSHRRLLLFHTSLNYAEGSGWGSRLACERRNLSTVHRPGTDHSSSDWALGHGKGFYNSHCQPDLSSTVHGRKCPARKTSLRHGNHTSDDEPFPLSKQYQYDTRLQHTSLHTGAALPYHSPPSVRKPLPRGKGRAACDIASHTKERDLTRRRPWLPTLFNSTTHLAGPPSTEG